MPPSKKSAPPAAAAPAPAAKTTKKEQQPASDSSSSDSDDSSDADDDAPASGPLLSSPEDEAAAIRLFNVTSPRRERMVLHYVSTPAEVKDALAVLSAQRVLSVDCEGVSLSRTGELCLVQVSTACDPVTRVFHVYLFDVVALGRGVFDTGLGALLASPKHTKLFYDVRRDSEALFHQYGIRLAGVCDMQLMEIAHRRARNQACVYLPGLARLLSERFSALDSALQAIKDGMSGKYAEHPDLWQKRPLTRDQTVYAAVDVALLHVLLEELTTPSPSNTPGAQAQLPAGNDAAPAEANSSSEDASIDVAMRKLTGGDASSPSASGAGATPSQRGGAGYVNPHTRQLVEQYSDVVWAASIRDLEGEQDQWSRRHVPLDFQHATFPLSLQAACAVALAAQQARLEAQAPAKPADKRKKRKAAPEPPKIAAAFSAASATPAAASSSAASSSSAAAPSQLSTFVQRMARTPAARNNYSGLAHTLKHMRAQQQPNAGAKSARSQGRQVPYAADASSSAAAAVSSAAAVPAPPSSSAAAAAHAVSRMPLLSHVGNPLDFHPQVTKAFVAQHQKTANQPTLKKHKISHAF